MCTSQCCPCRCELLFLQYIHCSTVIQKLLGTVTSDSQGATIDIQLTLLEMKVCDFILRNLMLLEHVSNGFYFSEMICETVLSVERLPLFSESEKSALALKSITFSPKLYQKLSSDWRGQFQNDPRKITNNSILFCLI